MDGDEKKASQLNIEVTCPCNRELQVHMSWDAESGFTEFKCAYCKRVYLFIEAYQEDEYGCSRLLGKRWVCTKCGAEAADYDKYSPCRCCGAGTEFVRWMDDKPSNS